MTDLHSRTSHGALQRLASLAGAALLAVPFTSTFAAPARPQTSDRTVFMLDESGSSWVGFGGNLRARVEDWNEFNFGAPPNVSHDDTYVLTRALVHADFHPNAKFRVYAELKSAMCPDRDLPGGVRTVDEDRFELQQLFAEFKFDLGDGSSLTLKPGRQMIGFGGQRLVSPLPWANALRTWDGVSAVLASHGWTVTGFGASFVPVQKGGIGRANNNEQLFGVYARRAPKPNDGLELYALRNQSPTRSFNGTSGEDRRWTFGVRRWSPFWERGDYEFEASAQIGKTGAGDVNAWSFASQAGWQVDADKKTRVFVGLDWASGDRAKGGDVGTFNQLYPLGHAYFGIIDAIGRQNIFDLSAGATFKATPKVTLVVEAHSFSADSTRDAIYNAGGGVVRAGGTYSSSEIGAEADFVVKWNPSKTLAVEGGYGHFFAGKAIEQSGPSNDTNFLYLQSVLTF